MDPGQVLSAVADRPAEAELKGGCHFAENTAPRSQYHAGAQQADAGALALRFAGNLFPAGAQLMGKLIVRWLFFGHHHLAEVAIVADGRPADQHGGRGVAGVDQAHQPLREIPAAMAQALFLLGRPAFISDGFTRQIDDGINVIEVVMALEIAPQGDARIETGAGGIRMSRGDRDAMPELQQSGYQMSANQAGTTSKQDLHTTSLTWLATPAHGHGHRVGIAQRMKFINLHFSICDPVMFACDIQHILS